MAPEDIDALIAYLLSEPTDDNYQLSPVEIDTIIEALNNLKGI